MAATERLVVATPDGRELDLVVDGTEGLPLVFHNGTPNAAVTFPPLVAAAQRHGMRVVSWSRPGYGNSTAHPGRSVADVVPDAVAVLDGIDAPEFVTLGWSGGGPHALACGAVLPGRCRGVATMGSTAPYHGFGAGWLEGMNPEGQAEFGAALAGEATMAEYAAAAATGLGGVTAEGVIEGLGALVDEVDRAAITPALAEWLAACLRLAALNGPAGWRDDDLAFVAPWGFEPDQILVPTAVWHGRRDLMVPPSHGEHLAARIPGARPRLLDDEGHISLAARIEEIVDDLAR